MVIFILAIIIAALYVKTLMGTMSNVATQKQANVYMVQNSFKVHSQKDRFVFSNVVKTAKPQNNNGGGSGGRGGSPRGGGPRGGGQRGGGGRGGRR